MNVKLPGWVTFILRAATLPFVCLPRFFGKPGANFFKFSMEVIRLTIVQKTFMLRRGRHLRGTRPPNIAQDMDPARLRRFFVKEEADYRVKKNTREMMVFATQTSSRTRPSPGSTCSVAATS